MFKLAKGHTESVHFTDGHVFFFVHLIKSERWYVRRHHATFNLFVLKNNSLTRGIVFPEHGSRDQPAACSNHQLCGTFAKQIC